MRRAVALSGGGSKGSYEVGVWKALLELGVDYEIVTGTSIGAVNGALMSVREYEHACEIWDTIEITDLMQDGVNMANTIEEMFNQREAIRPLLKKYVKNKGADVSPFIDFVNRMVDEDRVRGSDVDFGLVTVKVSPLKGLELTTKEIPHGLLKDYILASASIFPIFPMHEIKGEQYLDGCYYDNLPIDLALKMGADEVVAVDLHSSPQHANYVNKPYVRYVVPSKPLGVMLNFDHAVLDANRRLGYYDAMRTFGRMAGNAYLFYQEDLGQYEEKIRSFVGRVARMEAHLTEGAMSKFSKPGDGRRLCGQIEDHIPEKTYTKQDYFVGGAEICGEIFGLPQGDPWHMAEFVDSLFAQVIPEEQADLTIFKNGNPMGLASRLAEVKRKRDSRYLASCIYYGFQKGRIGPMEQLGLLNFASYELAAALFLVTMA